MNAFFIHGDGTATVFACYRGRPWAFLTDAADLPQITRRPWHILYNGYVRSVAASAVSRPLYLHRLLLDAQPGQEVHHINHNGLDNRRANLRIARSARASTSRRLST